ncbi:DUF4279 domain-containing protein [Leifsonia flava]|uniref:DUF4279 domain-containing protein n=1 Tax=Orlajensenia leifsoniae TaxID=2561933 RepID=A0A4Y9R5F6_9MICO|nr:DUF4279 domain-containing protein [Leifsonia flava]
MIQSGRASLVVHSTTTDPAEVSRILGLQPTRVNERGSVRRSGRILDHNTWRFDVDEMSNTEDDRTGLRSLTELLARVRVAAGRVGLLPPDCEARIWWHGSSDSSQGGFVIPVELASDVAALGVAVHATVYLDQPADEL